MKKITNWFGIVLSLFAISQVLSKRERQIQYLNFNANITRSELFSLPLRTSFNIKQISLEFTVTQNISEWSAIFSADIIPDRKTPTHVFMLNVNICDCLSLTCRNKFMAPLLKEIMRTSNFHKKCPLPENNNYYIRNYTSHSEDYPSYLPEVTWQVHIDILFSRKTAMQWFIKGRTGKF